MDCFFWKNSHCLRSAEVPFRKYVEIPFDKRQNSTAPLVVELETLIRLDGILFIRQKIEK